MDISKDYLTDEESSYTLQYKRLHIDTLELKIKEKDQLLLELSNINQEIYQEMADLQQKLSLFKQERDVLLQDNIKLKDQIHDKSCFIQQQDQVIHKLRGQVSELTNGNSFSFEDKSVKNSFILELKNLQSKYDYREDLIVSLQDERVQILNEIDRIRYKSEIIDQLSRILDTQPVDIINKAKMLKNSGYNNTLKSESLLASVAQELQCQSYDQVLPALQILNSQLNAAKNIHATSAHQLKAYENTMAKVKKYFHLHANTSLDDLDRYIVNLTL